MATAVLRDEPGTVYDAATRQAAVTYLNSLRCCEPGSLFHQRTKINQQKSADRETRRERGGEKFQLASWNVRSLLNCSGPVETAFAALRINHSKIKMLTIVALMLFLLRN